MANIVLISCVKSKKDVPMAAKHLYTSPLFRKGLNYAEIYGDKYYILSAKHGLLSPETVIGPYEETLKSKRREERQIWASKVLEKLKLQVRPNDKIIFLAGAVYREYLSDALKSMGFLVEAPLEGKSLGQQIQALNRLTLSCAPSQSLDRFYEQLKRLEVGLNGGRLLRECHGRLEWARRGVYFMFEPRELRLSNPSVQRVVRVGTHAVSKGSKSTLWQRLSTHRGTSVGEGNHRSSILRLHVGMALIQRSKGKLYVPTWSKGQIATPPTLKEEKALEKRVSKFMGQMKVLWLDVPDQPGPGSDRAYIERNSIALLARCARLCNPASKRWLGNHSPKEKIRTSALWNLNHVDELYDDNFLDVLATYIDITLGVRPSPSKSLAPPSWNLRPKGHRVHDQLKLFAYE